MWKRLSRLIKEVFLGLRPNQRLAPTREGRGYFLVWLGLLAMGLYQQSNLILLVAGLAAGPVVASLFVSSLVLRGLKLARRAPAFVFAGDPLAIDYALENGRRRTAALALEVEDEVLPTPASGPAGARVEVHAFFARVPGRSQGRLRWQGTAPGRGRYKFQAIELITRAPFGLLERRMTIAAPGELIVYPRVGQLSRRWHQVHREATETRSSHRHDRTTQQQEYHGLRDYRAGDSPRWIHWRTSARIGRLMVKEFEQQSEHNLTLLLDPWLPRNKATAEQRETIEEAIRFAATVCLETCREMSNRRLVLGWTGAAPGLRQGPASIKLLHELLTQLATMRPTAQGTIAALIDALPPQALRDSLIVVVSTRPINLAEEFERSSRLSSGSGRGLTGRVLLLDASRGDLGEYLQARARDLSSVSPPVPDERPA